jgi:hypothetical protein
VIDFDRIVGFDWDRGNDRKSVEKHNVSQAEAEQVFLNEPLLLSEDGSHSVAEQRLHALGRSSGGRYLNVTFTLRRENSLIRVISARDMNRKERKHYEQDA